MVPSPLTAIGAITGVRTEAAQLLEQVQFVEVVVLLLLLLLLHQQSVLVRLGAVQQIGQLRRVGRAVLQIALMMLLLLLIELLEVVRVCKCIGVGEETAVVVEQVHLAEARR